MKARESKSSSVRLVDERIKDAVDSLTHVPRLQTLLKDVIERVEALERQFAELATNVERLSEERPDRAERRSGGK